MHGHTEGTNKYSFSAARSSPVPAQIGFSPDPVQSNLEPISSLLIVC